MIYCGLTTCFRVLRRDNCLISCLSSMTRHEAYHAMEPAIRLSNDHYPYFNCSFFLMCCMGLDVSSMLCMAQRDSLMQTSARAGFTSTVATRKTEPSLCTPKHSFFKMAAPNPPPPPRPPDGPPDVVRHPNCFRVQARQDRSTTHQLDAQGLLRFYPTIPSEVMNAPSGGTIQMSHPERYLPPSGGHYVVGDSERVQVPVSLGSTRCANCFQRFEQDSKCFRKQCPNACGYCDQRHDTTAVSLKQPL